MSSTSKRVHLGMSDDPRLVQRQAFAGLLWGKQSYHYDVGRWLRGDPTQPTPDPAGCRAGITIGPTCTIQTSSPCRTNGNIRGTPRGIWRSIAWQWR